MQTITNPAEGGAAAPTAAAPTPRPYVSFEYVCKFCFKTFKSGHALGGHQNLHRNDEQREVGKYCGLTFGFEDRRKRNAVATRPGTRRVQRRGVVADGSGRPGVVARDSILAMVARARLNNQNQGGRRRRRPPIAPMLQVPGESTGTETGPGTVYSPETILPGCRLNQGPTWGAAGINLLSNKPGLHSVVGDNFSNHGFNRRTTPPTLMVGNGNYYHPYGQQPPYGGFLEDHFGRFNVYFSCSEAATLVSECRSMEVTSHPNNGVDLELKL